VAAARLARRHGHEVGVYDRSSRAVAPLRNEGYAIHSGAWSPRLLHEIDLVITSPGIPEHAEPIRDTICRELRLVSEMEFAAAHLRAPYVAVTGTNGKTTVVEATAAMLAASGRVSCAAGNIGMALSGVVDAEWDAVVVEASSFQLRFIDTFRPAAAAVTNVAPDHLDWHGSEAAYADAKARIFENMGTDDTVVYDGDDPGATSLVSRSDSTIVEVSGTRVTADGYGLDGMSLRLGDLTVDAPDVGGAFLADLAAAAVLARAAGADDAGIAATVETFRPGLHRRTLVAEHRGVRYVDDSKATNPHAAVASAQSFTSVILIAGGRNKGLNLAPLGTVSTVKHLIGLGEAADELARVAGSRFDRAATMEEAVALAASRAAPGDVVLLAPGCASFDMYDSYATRGESFVASVRALEGAA
jgi:UDP-N-acetylmuramoylalanine--D-glutamate ligase